MARILIAEDEESVRNLVSRALQLQDHEVKAVVDGSAALEALSHDEYDLLLTDIVMPAVDGIALALKASAEYPALRILMMTGYAEQKRRAHNLDVLIHDVLLKPFSIEELAQAVEQTVPIRLSPIPTTSRVLPIPRVKLGLGRAAISPAMSSAS